jgi:hypothetical protein
MAEKMTERDQFYYGKGYADGKKELSQSVCDILRNELYDYAINNGLISNFDAGYEAGIKRAMKILRGQAGVDDGT